MPITAPTPEPTTPPADFSDAKAVSERMVAASDRIAARVPQVALARQVREYDGDRRKAALARAMTPLLRAGASAAAAEAEARASAGYSTALKTLAAQYEAAEQTLAEHEADRIAFEAGRSLLSLEKAMSNL